MHSGEVMGRKQATKNMREYHCSVVRSRRYSFLGLSTQSADLTGEPDMENDIPDPLRAENGKDCV
jgi:hypothetical protein